jgi:long-chain acyl-CoA synthetase
LQLFRIFLIKAKILDGANERKACRFSKEYRFSYYACFKIGAIAVPLNYRYKGPELEYAVSHCGAKILIVHDELFPEYASVRKNLEAIEKCYLVGVNNNSADISDFSDLL